VFVALGNEQAKGMRRTDLSVDCPGLQYFSTLYHKRHDFREENVIDIKMCVWIFSTTDVRNVSRSKKNCARYDQKCILVFI
jgi:hypothetical protein